MARIWNSYELHCVSLLWIFILHVFAPLDIKHGHEWSPGTLHHSWKLNVLQTQQDKLRVLGLQELIPKRCSQHIWEMEIVDEKKRERENTLTALWLQVFMDALSMKNQLCPAVPILIKTSFHMEDPVGKEEALADTLEESSTLCHLSSSLKCCRREGNTLI